MFQQKLLSSSVNYCTKRYKLNLSVGKNANNASNNGMCKKRDKVKFKRIVLDLHNVTADSKKIVVFEYKNASFILSWKAVEA